MRVTRPAKVRHFTCQVCGDFFSRTKTQMRGRTPQTCGAYHCRQEIGRLHANRQHAAN